MRLQYLPLMMLLAVVVSAPAWAQIDTIATPDTVVARLMSFDRNGDGRIVVDELPERMQWLLPRGDSSSDGSLDRSEVNRLVTASADQRVQQVLNEGRSVQSGHWGVGGDFSFDTSQHIDDALDDLRLAGDTKERAVGISRMFLAGADDRAMDDLLAAMGPLLSREQLDDFRAAAKGRAPWQTVNVPAIRRGGVTFFGAIPEEAAGQERVMVPLLQGGTVDLASYIEKYALDGDRKTQALAAVGQFKAHIPGRLNDTERSALLEQFRGLLTDEQRDDLRAALGRRPVVKLAGEIITPELAVLLRGRSAISRTAEPTVTFGAQDLVLKR